MADFFGQDGQNDTLAGGGLGEAPVNDRLFGGTGDDSYTFSLPFGFDQIIDSGGTDRVIFDATITPDRVRLGSNGTATPLGTGDLYVRVVDEAGTLLSWILVSRHLSGQAVEVLEFADGTVIDLLAGLTIEGLPGLDTLVGTPEGDRLVGSARSEILRGEDGNDSYLIRPEGGFDTLSDTAGLDRILVADGASADDLVLSYLPNGDLYIRLLPGPGPFGTGIAVKGHLTGQPVEEIVFADGTVIDLLAGQTIRGGPGFTLLWGSPFDDRLIAGARDETLYGGRGNDSYELGAGGGSDRIRDDQGTDRIVLAAGIAADDLWFDTSEGGDLFLSVIDGQGAATATLTVERHFTGRAVEEIVFADGTVLDLLGGLTIRGAAGNADLRGTVRDDLLIGSSRDERFDGRAGSDIYRTGADPGFDSIADGGGRDVLDLTGVAGHRVELEQSPAVPADLLVRIRGPSGFVTGQVALTDHFRTGAGQIETIRIGAETFSIAAQLAGPVATGAADRIGSFFGDTVIEGGGGDDWIADLLGSNALRGGAGRDRLFGGDGNDRLDGGGGGDTLTGGKGADDFVFANGMGRDRVMDFGTGADELVLNDNLWRGNLTARQVVERFAEDTGRDIVLDFGRKGVIVLEDLANTRGLAGEITIV